MSVPEFQSFMLPILKLFEDKKIHTIKECKEIVIKYFSLNEEDIKNLVPSGKQTLVENRVYWSLTYLKKSVLIESINRGEYRITDRGLKLLNTKPERIDKKLLSQYREYRIFSNQDEKEETFIKTNELQVNEVITPEENIDQIYKKINDQLAEDLLEIILEKDGYYFERLVMDVLIKMGYGNFRNEAKEIAISKLNDVVILDTAGRLQIDESLMQELKDVKSNVKPHEILLVVDSMTGQEAVNIASKFNEDLGIDGVILTKLDGDTRGGAAISVKKVTGKPIKFAGTGEKLNEIEEFHPDRMASRILGMGDVLSIIEQAEEAFDAEEAEKLEKKLRKNKDLDLNDYLAQLKQVKKLGSFSSILKMIPGMNKYNVNVDDKEFNRIEAIICSMTDEERQNPKLLNASRRIRIAKGSGTQVQDINKFMKSFEITQSMMKKMRTGNLDPRMKKMMKGMNLDKMSEEDLKELENKLGK